MYITKIFVSMHQPLKILEEVEQLKPVFWNPETD